MIMFVLATCLSCYMIHDSYLKWNEKPVIVSMSEKSTPVWKIPFPAVTICPEAKISAKMVNVTKTFHELLHKYQMSKPKTRSSFKMDLDIPPEEMFKIFKNVSEEK